MKKLIKKILNSTWNLNLMHYLVIMHSFLNLIVTRDLVIHYSKKIIYLPIAKSACSTIKVSLLPPALVAEIEKAKINNTLNVDKIITDSQKKYSHVIEIININPKIVYKEYFTFSFVRNPFTRILSCYMDKCIKEIFFYKYYYFGVLSNVKNFDEFVRKICMIPNFLSENHFRSQFLYLYNFRRQLLVSYVGHVENIYEDHSYLKEKFGLNELQYINKTKKEKNWMDYYTKETAQLIYKKYFKDFKTFGYTQSYYELLNYLDNK